MSRALLERFRAKVMLTPGGCWEWRGWRNAGSGQTSGGYGRLWISGKHVAAHRLAYELFVGSIPEHLTLDHLCRNRGCVNPFHLEPVTMRDNSLRGISFAAKNAPKTHCPRGHPYDLFNTYVDPRGRRECRICKRLRDGRLANGWARQRARRRAEAAVGQP